MQKVITGIESAVENTFPYLNSARVGVLSNQASVDTRGNHLVDLLKQCGHCQLTKLFAPEHGYAGNAQDMVTIRDETDKETGIEIVSMYGDTIESLSPTQEDFENVDVLVIDLPNIGTRYYTFAQTMAYCMKAAGQAGVKVIVLDRPNPIGGLQIEGSPLQNDFRSFCGIGPIANRHGMTLGELATMFHQGLGEGEAAIEPHPCELEIIPITGWRRQHYLDETSIPWVKPSPNMGSLNAAILYPGTCLFEATHLSEGRGTDEPFLNIGAPFANPSKWLDALHSTGISTEGVRLQPTTFTPAFQKQAGLLCQGLRIEIENRNKLQPYRLGIALLIAASRAFPKKFQWRDDPYEFIKDVPAVDLLYGSSTLREVTEGKKTVQDLLAELERFESWYSAARTAYFLY